MKVFKRDFFRVEYTGRLTCVLLGLFCFAECGFISASVPGASITGKDVKKEIKKTREATFGLSFISLLGSFSSSSLSSSTTATAKTCPGFTTDTTAPEYTLPAPDSFSNVNLTGSVSSATPQLWTSASTTAASRIDTVLTNSSVSCRYGVNSVPTVSSGLLITGGSSVGAQITVNSASSIVSIICYTSSASAVSYTLSLNPRPAIASATSSPFTSLFSPETFLPDQIFAAVAKIDDAEVYTYDSFLKCKESYQSIILLYISATSSQLTALSQCGGFVAPPAQVYVQGLACNLKKAGFIEL